MISKPFSKFLILSFFINSCGIHTNIQRHSIEGLLIDENNNPVNDASVTFIIDENQKNIMMLSEKDSTITDNNGYYKFKEISNKKIGFMGGEATKRLPVSYKFTVEKKGFINHTVDVYYQKPNNKSIVIDTLKLKSEN